MSIHRLVVLHRLNYIASAQRGCYSYPSVSAPAEFFIYVSAFIRPCARPVHITVYAGLIKIYKSILMYCSYLVDIFLYFLFVLFFVCGFLFSSYSQFSSKLCIRRPRNTKIQWRFHEGKRLDDLRDIR